MSQQLDALRNNITQKFNQKYPIIDLLEEYTAGIDDIMLALWESQNWPDEFSFCLLATGGYGRKELFPYSDCDLAIIIGSPLLSHQDQSRIEGFIAAAWDFGLKIHSTVRTLGEAIEQAQKDHTSYSSLLENRFLLGDKTLYAELQQALFDDKTLPLARLILEKKHEQMERHHRYNETSYNLEPDIKNGPGGLRDLHILQWLTLRRYNSFDLTALCNANLINDQEYLILNQARHYLLSVRFALHTLAHRAEERLLFNYQPMLAETFHSPGENANEQVEAFMQTFFTNCHTVTVFSEIILSLFMQVSLKKPLVTEKVVGTDFFVYQNKIFLAKEKVFSHNPVTIMQIFVFYSQNPSIFGIAPNTIRALIEALPLVDESFRKDPIVNNFFLQILQSNRVYATLSLLSRYGVLGAYLPAFGHITRKMQYDLFHVYTVDAHTLFVIRNLEHFVNASNDTSFPLCAQIMRKIAHPEFLYLAALFHDIGKGYKKNHSIVGSELLEEFNQSLRLPQERMALIQWLVREHLLLSKTAQHEDINDPQVISRFAQEVNTISRLNHLYLLTVADIHATNEKLWNNWRASLLEELYVKTFRLLNNEKIVTPTREAITSEFPWEETKLPLIQIKQHRLKSATEIYIYSLYDEKLFCRIACTLDNLRFTIVEAATHLSASSKYCLSTYVVLEHDYTPIIRADRFAHLQMRLEEQLAQPNSPLPASHGWRKRQPTALRFATQVHFQDSPEKNCTIMTLLTRDRPGLLAQIGKIMLKQKISLQTAKISTLGDRVEDFFYVTATKTGGMLSEEQKQHFSEVVCAILDVN